MKRAKDRWTNGHLAVGLLFLSCLVLPSVSAVKATSLFRTTTTTTTTAPTEQDEASDGVDPAESDPGAPPPTNYTGIPQKDYIYDPNLPRELNGYNLSSYPFYETVPPPEEMDFKCDGLHDGFYASVPHKCQVYHHCLYGTRYDFLCANYTAFDQKTFICQFVSVVDCVNSPKYYHRNDDLYQATTTSTAAPLTTTTTTTAAPPPRPRGGGGRRRPPNRRPRPQYEYYEDDYYPSGRDDDYYEEERRSYGEGRGNRRRKRPRPRRPQYDEYEDDRYNRRPSRNRDEDDDEYEERGYERPRKSNRRPSDDRQRTDNKKKVDDDEDTRPYERPRKTFRPSEDKRVNDRPRRPIRDEESRYDNREEERDKHERNERPYRDERPMKDRPFRDERPRYDDRRNRDESSRDDDSPYADNKKNNDNLEPTANGGLVKPNGGSIYSKPRVPPKIARPVPSNEKDKYKYVPIASTEATKLEDDEYYDDYDIEETKPTSSTAAPSHKTRPEDREKYKSKDRNRSNFERDAPKRPLSDASIKYKSRRPEVNESKKVEETVEYVYDDEVEQIKPMKIIENHRDRYVSKYNRKRPVKAEDDYIYEDERPSSSSRASERQKISNERRKPSFEEDERRSFKDEENTRQKFTTTEASETEKSTKNGYVRVIKRPFLPSRGGSPYLPRGLQPLGGKNFNRSTTSTTSTTTQATTTVTTTTTTEKPSQADYSYETEYEVIDEKNMNQENYSEEVYPQSEKEESSMNNKPIEPEYVDSKQDSQNKHKNPEITQQNTKQQIPNDNISHEKQRPQFEPVNYDNKYKNPPTIPQKTVIKEPEVFRPSPQFTPPQKVTIKPYTPIIPENISIKQNLADSIENDYDVTINEALSPTLPNLTPIRSFPSPFSSDRDYSYSRLRNNNYQENNPPNQYNNYQYRNQQLNSNPYKYSSPARGGLKFAKNADSSASASDPIIVGVSVRTPQSYYIQQPRHPSTFTLDDDSDIRTSHLIHRHIKKSDYHI